MFKPLSLLLLGSMQLFMLAGIAQTITVIKGKVLHPVNDFIIISVDGLLENSKDSVLVSDSGYFKQEISLEKGSYVTIPFSNQNLRFPVLPGDSIDLTLDESLLTYNLAAANPQRKKEITAVLDNAALFEGRLEEINAAAEKRSDSLLNVIYNQQLKDFLQRVQQISSGTKETIHEIYYQHLMYWLKVNSICALKPNEKIIGKELYNKFASLIPSAQEYLTLNEPLFYSSVYYRTFLLNFKNVEIKSDSTHQNNPVNYQDRYQTIVGDVQIPAIRDWLIMNFIRNIYRYGRYEDAIHISDEYKPLCQNATIKERIKNMDLQFGQIKNGSQALLSRWKM